MEEPIGEAFAGAEQLAVIGRQFHVGEICKVSHQELLRRATTHGDPQAWAAFQKSLEETVLTWLHDHPGSNAACRLQSEQYFVVLAFEGLRQATIKGQVTCETLSEILVFLRVNLNRAILETLRDSKRPGAVSSIWSDGEDGAVRNDLWDWLQARLPTGRSSDWPTCSIIVDLNLLRLCPAAHRNGAISTKSLVCGVSS